MVGLDASSGAGYILLIRPYQPRLALRWRSLQASNPSPNRYRRRQVKIEDIAKFHTEPTTAPATPASHQVWLEVKA